MNLKEPKIIKAERKENGMPVSKDALGKTKVIGAKPNDYFVGSK